MLSKKRNHYNQKKISLLNTIMCWSKAVASFITDPSFSCIVHFPQYCASSANALFCILHSSVHLAHNVFVRHGGPRARPGWTPTIRLSFHYFVIGFQRPPIHAINPVPSPHLHHFVCKLSPVCPCYFLPKSSVSSPGGPLFFLFDFCVCCCYFFLFWIILSWYVSCLA